MVLAIVLSALLHGIQGARQPNDDPAPKMGFGSPPMVALQKMRPSSRAVDVVILGEGYQRNELAAYARHAATAMENLLSVPPLKENRHRFNFYRVDVVSRQSGVTIGDKRRDTAFDVSSGPQGGMTVGNKGNLRLAALRAHVTADFLILIVNLGVQYVAFQDGMLVVSHQRAGDWGLPHELGHLLGGLGDEYEDVAAGYHGTMAYEGPEPPSPNLTKNRDILTVKWRRYLGQEGVDLFEGGLSRTTGIHRPTESGCLMREGTTLSFCLVCRKEGIEPGIEYFCSSTAPRLQVQTGPGEIRLSWNDSVQGEEEYWLMRRNGLSPFWYKVAAIPANGTGYVDRSARQTQDYSYRVEPFRRSLRRRLELRSNLVTAIAGPLPPASLQAPAPLSMTR